MDMLQNYAGSSDDEDRTSAEHKFKNPYECNSLSLNSATLDAAPVVDGSAVRNELRLVDPTTSELSFNPRYEELFQPVVS